jgi:electron transport complex protein RnfB
MEGIMRLADVLQRQPKPLNAFHGLEKPRVLAVIEEEWCIGCTKCLDACPTDAILGASKRMHTVIDSHCTGCELCIPVCPVDCIRTLDASGTRTGWAAWSETQASQALVRYQQHSARIAHKTNTAESLVRVENFPADALERDIPEKSLQGIQIPLHSASSTAAHQKRALIEAAMQRARTLKTL